MQVTNPENLFVPYIPVLIFVGLIYLRKGYRRYFHPKLRLSENQDNPVGNKLLRSPGESLVQEVEEWNEHISMALIFLFFGPVIFFAVSSGIVGSDKSEQNISLIGYTLITVLILCWLWWALTQRSERKLGLMGERAVGEELNKLMEDGCRVYHDFKKDDGGNIDHVVVASSGVYCVETKCWRKSRGPDGHKIKFDGEAIHSPRGTSTGEINQTKGHVRKLSKWLSNAVGEEVPVKGILTFPGWFVTSTSEPTPNLRVLNPGMIRGDIRKGSQGVLSEKQIKQIGHQLDQNCRDVEF